jgi:soluble lytic murein transglycosylase-like protein
MNWTVSFRPLNVLRYMLALAMLVALVMLPRQMSDAPPRPTAATLAYRSAHRTVSTVLADRMDYLDEARRVALATTIVVESAQAGFDPLFILAVIDVESRFDMEAVSPTGARGLMQVVPSTWNEEVERSGLGRLEKFNPAHNVKVGVRYLRFLSEQFKHPRSLLLAYNQGPGAAWDILKRRADPTPEARSYADKVLTSYRRLRGAFEPPGPPPAPRKMLALR